MRAAFTIIHRWVGLIIAAFVFIAAVTGTIISWDHELDEWLNPQLNEASGIGRRQSSFDLARQIEARDSRVRVVYMVLDPLPGRAQHFYVDGRINPETKRPFELEYSQVAIDPVTGDELGRRKLGVVWPLGRDNFVSFLYRLHYTLHIPEMFGINRWGRWLMGGIAILWLVDCFVGFYLTLPIRKLRSAVRNESINKKIDKGFWQRWKPAWVIKLSGSAYRINFDIHRAFSLWTWSILFVLAFTSFSLNLHYDVFFPLLSKVSKVTPSAYDKRIGWAGRDPVEPTLTFEDALATASAEAKSRGWTEPAGSVAFTATYSLYRVSFFVPGGEHGTAGVGPAELYYDGTTGHLEGVTEPWRGTAADIFVQAQFPLHSGRILGLPGRILISTMGLVCAALSVTGVVIWYRKRRARLSARAKATMRGNERLMPAE